ncbi:MAG: Mor transcription activator family protein [Burkholderiales bacterium]
MDLLNELQLEHLEGEQLRLAEAIGIEAYRQIIRMYAGTMLYVPTVDAITRKTRDILICKEYNGHNQRALALKYGISEQWVRSIVGVDTKPVDGQIGMFEKVL